MKILFKGMIAAAMLAGPAAAPLMAPAIGQTADVPPNAEPGRCYARVLMPETAETITETVLVKPASSEIRLVPAEFETYSEQVLVKEQTTEFVTIPATYTSVTEDVMVQPEYTETVVVPAEYETYTEEVLVRAAYVTWKPGSGLFGRADTGSVAGLGSTNASVATGELLCRVEVPAQFDTVTRTRLVSPERTEVRTIPARFETVTRQVVATPARIEEKIVPAVFETVQKRRQVAPAREETISIPAQYETVEKRQVTGGGGLEWREVLCDTNASASKIREVQAALTDAGYPTLIDGQFGPSTLRAMEAFQRDQGMPVGYLTVATVTALGVNPY
ncbi:MAG: peptidoglycan-binding domain-containing protein [Pseudomonadota bacterium]